MWFLIRDTFANVIGPDVLVLGGSGSYELPRLVYGVFDPAQQGVLLALVLLGAEGVVQHPGSWGGGG